MSLSLGQVIVPPYFILIWLVWRVSRLTLGWIGGNGREEGKEEMAAKAELKVIDHVKS